MDLLRRDCIFRGLLDEATRRFDEGNVVELCYSYFSKAFDLLNDRLPVQKIQSFGNGNSVLNWVSDFLMNKSFCVRVEGESSGCLGLSSDARQGSVLRQLLFFLCITDLGAPCFIFADGL